MARRNPYVKKAHEVVEYTPEQIVELKKCSEDPIYFIETYIKIVHPVQGAVNFQLYSYEKKLIKTFYEKDDVIVLASRQVGKCVTDESNINVININKINLLKRLVLFFIDRNIHDQLYHHQKYLDAGRFGSIKTKIINWCLGKKQTTIGKFHRDNKPLDCLIYDQDNNKLKFIEKTFLNKILIETPSGFYPIKHSYKTVKYDVWKLETDSCLLYCADNHIVISDKNEEIFVSNLKINDKIYTKFGIEKVTKVERSHKPKYIYDTKVVDSWLLASYENRPQDRVMNLNDDEQVLLDVEPFDSSTNYLDKVHMYDLEIDNDNHLYYANNIISHNSICSSAYLFWFTIFNFDKVVLIASNKESSAKEMIGRIQFAYENLPFWLKPGVTEGGWNKFSLAFDNGSRILSEATTEKSGRSLSISLLYLDEFAFVPANIADDFWTSISPTLSTGGKCIVTSTPNGDLNLFSRLWRGADLRANGFEPFEIQWNEPPGRDEAFKKAQIAKIGERKWLQEYECVFLSSDALLIDSLHLANETERLKHVKPVFTIRDVVFWKRIEKRQTYLIGVDPSTGSGEDFTVICGYSFPDLEQVFEFRSNTMSSPTVYITLKNIIRYIEKNGGNVYFTIENNGVGQGVIALYEADETPIETAEFVSEEGAKKYGVNTTHRTKMRACVNFKEMYEKRRLIINSMFLLKELKSFVRKSGSYEAQLGATDDSVSASLLIMRLLDEISTYDQQAFDKLNTYDDEDWFEHDDQEHIYDETNPDHAPLPFTY